jgi:hypothetical protein
LDNEFYCRILERPKITDFIGNFDGNYYRIFARGGVNLVHTLDQLNDFSLTSTPLAWAEYLNKNNIEADLGFHHVEIMKEDYADKPKELVILKTFLQRTLQFNCPYLRVPAKYFEDEFKIYLVFDDQFQELTPYIATLPVGDYNERIVITLVKQLISAMKYLHDRSLCLITQHGGIDFGIKRSVYGEIQLQLINYTHSIGDYGVPSYFYSPEAIIDRKTQSPSSDLFSLGSLTMYLLMGSYLYNVHPKRLLFQIGKFESYKINDPQKELSKQARNFVLRLLKRNPEDRMTLSEALEHPWLTDPQPSTSPLRTAHVAFFSEFYKKKKEAENSSDDDSSSSDSW